MAKIQGPLMSIAAAGTIGSTLCFRATKSGPVVQSPPIPASAPTQRQITRRDKFRVAALAWADLTPNERDQWINPGARLGISAQNRYIAEYLRQYVIAPQQPQVPLSDY